MKLFINGEEREVAPGLTLAALLEQLGMKADRVAVELNREIAARERWSATTLAEGDRLEIVHFVGGGGDALPNCRNAELPNQPQPSAFSHQPINPEIPAQKWQQDHSRTSGLTPPL